MVSLSPPPCVRVTIFNQVSKMSFFFFFIYNLAVSWVTFSHFISFVLLCCIRIQTIPMSVLKLWKKKNNLYILFNYFMYNLWRLELLRLFFPFFYQYRYWCFIVLHNFKAFIWVILFLVSLFIILFLLFDSALWIPTKAGQ